MDDYGGKRKKSRKKRTRKVAKEELEPPKTRGRPKKEAAPKPFRPRGQRVTISSAPSSEVVKKAVKAELDANHQGYFYKPPSANEIKEQIELKKKVDDLQKEAKAFSVVAKETEEAKSKTEQSTLDYLLKNMFVDLVNEYREIDPSASEEDVRKFIEVQAPIHIEEYRREEAAEKARELKEYALDQLRETIDIIRPTYASHPSMAFTSHPPPHPVHNDDEEANWEDVPEGEGGYRRRYNRRGGSRRGGRTINLPFIGEYDIPSLNDLINGRTKASPQVRKYIREYQGRLITELVVCRVPINEGLVKLLKLASNGSLEEARKRLGYDQLYHLSLNMEFDKGSPLKIEKNETVKLYPGARKGDCRVVDLKGKRLTINDIILGVQRIQGNKTYQYNLFNNNCQIFVTDILKAVGLLTEASDRWINQDAVALLKDEPSLLKKLLSFLPSLGNRLDLLLSGKGRRRRGGGPHIPGAGDIDDIMNIVEMLQILHGEGEWIHSNLYYQMVHTYHMPPFGVNFNPTTYVLWAQTLSADMVAFIINALEHLVGPNLVFDTIPAP